MVLSDTFGSPDMLVLWVVFCLEKPERDEVSFEAWLRESGWNETVIPKSVIVEFFLV